MKKLLLLCCLIYPVLVYSQAPEYQRFMDPGKRELRAKKYVLAGKKFAAAMEFAGSEQEKQAARQARKDAERLRVEELEKALRKAETIIGYFGFQEGRAWAYRDGEFALIDNQGRRLTEFEFENPEPFNTGGMAIAQMEMDGLYHFVYKEGAVSEGYNYLIPTDNGWYKASKGSLFSMVDNKGSRIPGWDWYEGLGAFSEGLVSFKRKGKWGYLDKTGHVIVPPQFDVAEPFVDGLAKVNVGRITTENGTVVVGGKWGLIDKTGAHVAPVQYDQISPFSEDLARVQVGNEWNNRWGYIDKTGREIFAPRFYEASDFADGLARVKVNAQANSWGLISRNKVGQFTLNPEFNAILDFSEGLAAVLQDLKWGVVNQSGRMILPPQFDGVDYFSDGLAWIRQAGKSGLVDSSGHILIEPTLDLSGQGLCYHGLLTFKKSDKWGVMDKTGHMVVEPRYEAINYWEESLSAAKIDGKWGYIDVSKGDRWIIEPQFEYADYFSEGLAAVKMNGKWGFVDKKGKIVIPAYFDAVSYFSEGLCGAQKDGKWGFASEDGTWIIPARYQQVGIFKNGVAQVQRFDETFRINKKGEMVVTGEPSPAAAKKQQDH